MERVKYTFLEQEQTVVLGEVAKLKQAQAVEEQLPLRVKEMTGVAGQDWYLVAEEVPAQQVVTLVAQLREAVVMD